jgi:hypothetical protein
MTWKGLYNYGECSQKVDEHTVIGAFFAYLGFSSFFLLWTFDDSLDEFFSMVCGGREAR